MSPRDPRAVPCHPALCLAPRVRPWQRPRAPGAGGCYGAASHRLPPTPVSFEALATIFIALAVGSFAKSVTGLGLPLIAVPVMATVLGVQTAVVTMVFPSTVTNAILLWTHRRAAQRLSNLVPLIAFGVLGTIVGTWGLSRLDDGLLSLFLAAWVAFYLVYAALKPKVELGPRASRILAPPVGIVAGLLQGTMGTCSPIIGPYVHAYRLEPSAYIFAVTSFFMTVSLAQIVSMIQLDLFTTERVYGGLLALVPALAVMPIAIHLSKRMSRSVFDTVIKVMLVGIGLKLAAHGLFGW
ncbi:MAG: sulfite exporter TauE/SafE family protein [Alphaproteobacteria bacterium]|nr:sulfite exporter TauE/SafE family protein [Alphaproteobacteria bacterium]